MTAAEMIQRARGQLGQRTRYKLGAGGFSVNKAAPGGGGGHGRDECDCSGFVCWALNISRLTRNDYYVFHLRTQWISTVSMYADCGDTAGLFLMLESPRPGCVVVYPDGALRQGAQGHIGIVTEVMDNQVRAILHCSSGNYRRSGDAVDENLDPTWARMLAKSRFGWYVGLS